MRIGKSTQLSFLVHYFLHFIKGFLDDDGGVGIFGIVLGKFPIVVFCLAAVNIGFLKERISGVAFLP